MMTYFSFTSLYIFSGVFNLAVSMLMFYLRSMGGLQSYTKSQLWGLTILGWMFFFNGASIICDAYHGVMSRDEYTPLLFPVYVFIVSSRYITGFLLLSFGLVYPRPVFKWNILTPLLAFLMAVGVLVVGYDLYHESPSTWPDMPLMNPVQFMYLITIFIPIHIWISHYSRQTFTDGRMMFTILIWGYLYAMISERALFTIEAFMDPSRVTMDFTIYFIVVMLTLFRLSLVLWQQRARWSSAEWMHLIMLAIAIILGINASFYSHFVGQDTPEIAYISRWFVVSAGWMLIRPAIFSWGLLRYRLLGDQLKGERLLAMMGGLLGSTILCLGIINLMGWKSEGAVPAGLLIAILLWYPIWKMSERFVTRLLPMSAGAGKVSMKEKRNTYLMSLQTGVVHGRMTDEQDRDALRNLREELCVSEREHELLLDSIAQHEGRREGTTLVEEAYLILRDGRLIAHYEEGREGLSRKGLDDFASGEKDVVAGMFTAVRGFVDEALSRVEEEGDAASMDSISFGASTLIIEVEGDLVLAMVLSGQDCPEIRTAMRDTLSEINAKYSMQINVDWDGNRAGFGDIDRVLARLAGSIDSPEQ